MQSKGIYIFELVLIDWYILKLLKEYSTRRPGKYFCIEIFVLNDSGVNLLDDAEFLLFL